MGRESVRENWKESQWIVNALVFDPFLALVDMFPREEVVDDSGAESEV